MVLAPLEVELSYHPRPYQLNAIKALNSGVKRVVMCWNRRSGKDLTIFNWCIYKLLQEVCTCYYVMPTYSQAKKVIWDALTIDGKRIIDYIPAQLIAQKNSQEMKIRLVNGSMMQLIGSDNIDSLMGTNPKIVVFSEYALQDPSAWDFIRPILAVNGGYAIFISTPRGKNHFWELYRSASISKDWFCEKLTIEDTKVLTREQYENELKEGMSEELALQEYYCSFDRGIDGSVYSKLIYKMRGEERICSIPHDPYKVTNSAWDIGWNDPSAVLFFQIEGNYINIIDAESYNASTLAEWAKIIKDKPYNYGVHLFPHDVDNIDGLGSGCTRKEILRELGINATTVPKHAISDAIEATKKILASKVRISSKCNDLLKSLEYYHYEWDDKHKVYGRQPRHDWSSHYADALKYLATGLHFVDTGTISLDSDYKALRSYWGA